MKINGNFQIEDPIIGLRLRVVVGKNLNRLKISRTNGECFPRTKAKTRDFFFTKDGAFDGTGSVVEE